MVKDIINFFKGVRIFLDEVELDEKDKLSFVSLSISPENRIIIAKKLIKRGYSIDVALSFFRRLFNLRRNDSWSKIRENLLDDDMKILLLKLGFKTIREIKIIDNNMIIATKNYNGLRYKDYRDFFNHYIQCILSNQYNVAQKNIKDKIVIDGGSDIGEFAIYCAKLGAKKVYAFEPVTENYNLLVNNIRLNNLNSKIIPIQKALGKNNERVKIYFNGLGQGNANINLNKSMDNFEIIEVVRLDDFLKEKVDFIKLDVEGYEENVLLGASNIIKRDKPILSLSAYHRPTDKIRLPKIIKSIRPDYKIELLNRGEEDFYCE